MSKHTKGPWFLFGNGHCVGGAAELPLSGEQTTGIAMCSMRLRSAEENEANARLIATAPDLLSNLKEFCSCFDDGDIECGNFRARDAVALIVKNANEVIARAEGQR